MGFWRFSADKNSVDGDQGFIVVIYLRKAFIRNPCCYVCCSFTKFYSIAL